MMKLLEMESINDATYFAIHFQTGNTQQNRGHEKEQKNETFGPPRR